MALVKRHSIREGINENQSGQNFRLPDELHFFVYNLLITVKRNVDKAIRL